MMETLTVFKTILFLILMYGVYKLVRPKYNKWKIEKEEAAQKRADEAAEILRTTQATHKVALEKKQKEDWLKEKARIKTAITDTAEVCKTLGNMVGIRITSGRRGNGAESTRDQFRYTSPGDVEKQDNPRDSYLDHNSERKDENGTRNNGSN